MSSVGTHPPNLGDSCRAQKKGPVSDKITLKKGKLSQTVLMGRGWGRLAHSKFVSMSTTTKWFVIFFF